MIGIRPDYVIEVRRDVLEVVDGPTLQFTLQGIHATRLALPRQSAERPDAGLLEERYDSVRAAS